jgi:hypothetical protein
VIARNGRSRPYHKAAPANTERAEHSTLTTLVGVLVQLRLDAVDLGRDLELNPALWPEAQQAFRLATGIASITRQVARW